MTAPERIWATGNGDTGSWNGRPATFSGPTETPYVHERLYTAQQETIAALVEALEESVQYVEVMHSLSPAKTQARKDLAAHLRKSRAALARAKEQA